MVSERNTTGRLRVDRLLLNPHFESYRLAPHSEHIEHPLSWTPCSLSCDPQAHFALQFLIQYELANHLFVDPFHAHSALTVDQEFNIRRISCNFGSINEEILFSIPKGIILDGSLNPSIVSLSGSLMIVADGLGLLYLAFVADHHNWRISNSLSVFEGLPFTIRDAKLDLVTCRILVVIQRVVDCVEGNKNSCECYLRCLLLEWDSRSKLMNILFQSSNITCQHSPAYIAVEPSTKAIVVLSDESLKAASHDVHSPATEPEHFDNHVISGEQDVEFISESGTHNVEAPPAYSWFQDDNEVGIKIVVDGDITISHLTIQYSSKHILVLVTKEQSTTKLVDGELSGIIKQDESVWTFDKDTRTIEVTLSKADSSRWTSLIIGHDLAPSLTQSQRNEMLERLDAFTSDNPIVQPSRPQFETNGEELEECDYDEYSSSSIFLFRYQCPSMIRTHKIATENRQYLFHSAPDRGNPPHIALKYNVDAVVFNIAEDASPRHCATFDALAYINASKRERKFMLCDLDCRYAVLAESYRHVFIYVKSPNVHEKNAVQHVVSLHSDAKIIGLGIVENGALVLTENSLAFIPFEKST